MSLDLTIGTRDALNGVRPMPEADASRTGKLWLQTLALVMGTACGVVLASAVSVVLFLV